MNIEFEEASTPQQPAETEPVAPSVETPDSTVTANEAAVEKETKAPDAGSNTDHAVILKYLEEQGYKPEDVVELVQQGRTLQSIAYQLEHNPELFLQDLERANPSVFSRFLETATDYYLKRHPETVNGSESGEPTANVAAELQALKSELNSIKSEVQQRQQSERLAKIQAEYNSRLDKYLDEAGLSGMPREAVRALINESVTKDQAALKRINAGSFVDIPRHVKAVLDRWTADTKKQSDAQHAERKRVQVQGNRPVFEAPSPTGGLPGGSDLWNAVETNFANALAKAGRR